MKFKQNAAELDDRVAAALTLFRKAFHIKRNDDLRWISLTYALQVFQTASQLGSHVL